MSDLTRSDFPEAFNGDFKPALTLRRCPSCHSRSFQLMESVEATTSFEVVDGKLNRAGGIHELGNFIGNVTGLCSKCGHRWTLKSATNLDMAVIDLDPQTLKRIYDDPAPPIEGEVSTT